MVQNMSLQEFENKGWVRPHTTSRQEIQDLDYLNTCRLKRNTVEYDYSGGATDKDADELIAFTKEFRDDLMHWLYSAHPEFT